VAKVAGVVRVKAVVAMAMAGEVTGVVVKVRAVVVKV